MNTFNKLAQSSADSLGRALPEKEHSFRNCFQRDRDRIVHSTAFRRLDGKTQVFLTQIFHTTSSRDAVKPDKYKARDKVGRSGCMHHPAQVTHRAQRSSCQSLHKSQQKECEIFGLNGQGDYYRTRLTHTIEVASISRTIARALGLNEDLVEAIALAHDLGHSPCGHAGEETLHHLMSGHGGFDHNEQSLRVVEILEESYPQHLGLNLSYEVLEGLRKHHRDFCDPRGRHYPSPSLEAQIADVADSIAYDSHDLDDGLEAGLITIDELESLEVWAHARDAAARELGYRIEPSMLDRHRKFILRCLINYRVESLITSSKEAIAEAQISSATEVRNFPKHLIQFNASQKKEYDALGAFLFQKCYRHPSIERANKNACDKIEALFKAFVQDPSQLGHRFFQRIEADGKHRAICDYIAGMTDRYLMSLHEDLVRA